MTTAELCERLPDMSNAAVYRQVSLPACGALLDVGGERRMRGFVEGGYRLRPERAVIDGDRGRFGDRGGQRPDFLHVDGRPAGRVHRERPDAYPAADPVGYRQRTVWLSPGERAKLIDDLRKVIAPRRANEPAADLAGYRRRTG